jgi:secreted PhoX family phosphatase
VEWIDLNEPDSPLDDLRLQGFAKGCARFAAGEGMDYSRGSVFFTATHGGSRKKGQIWKLTPSPFEGIPDERKTPGHLVLFVEPDDADLLDNGDNVKVSPTGEMYVCEDGQGDQYIVVVTQSGALFKFAKNAMNKSEFAGATFSADGSTFFVNIQSPGLTLAIKGNWQGIA